MALTFSGAGGLFTKIGHILGILLDINKVRGFASPAPVTSPDTMSAIPTKIDTLVADYAGGTAEKNIVDGLYAARNSWQGSQAAFLSTLQTLAINTLIDMVRADSIGNTNWSLPSTGDPLTNALKIVVAQMQGNIGGTQSYLVASSLAYGSQTNIGSPVGAYAATGNSGPIIVASGVDGFGLGLDYALTETLTAVTTSDASSGSATKWQEPISVLGMAPVTDTLSHLWPNGGGSGASVAFQCIDANLNNQGLTGNILQNSEFTTATTANYPDNWVKDVGVIGTDITQGTGSYRTDTGKNLTFVGDGSTLSSVYQPFNTPLSTLAGLGGCPFNIGKYPDVPFAVNFWVKVSVTPAAGVLEVALTDGSGTIIVDDQSTANKVQVTLSGISTTFVNTSAVFRLPLNPPATIRLRVRLSTAETSPKTCVVSHLAMTQMKQLYPGGPFIAIFGGNIAPLINDSWSMTATNTWGKLQQGSQRLFNMSGKGLRFPTTGGSAVLDTLVA